MIAMIGAPDPDTSASSTGSLLADAWAGIRYTFGNATLRGLGLSISLLNLSGGMITIVVPLIVLDRLHAPEVFVGLVFAGSGVAGMIAALVTGRMDSRGREWDLPRPADGRTLVLADLLLPGAAGASTAAGRDRVPGRRPRDRRPAQRSDGHRPVHDPPAPHGSGLDGAAPRRVDGLQLHRLPDRRGVGRCDRDRGRSRPRSSSALLASWSCGGS
jgi:hypothetical protein